MTFLSDNECPSCGRLNIVPIIWSDPDVWEAARAWQALRDWLDGTAEQWMVKLDEEYNEGFAEGFAQGFGSARGKR